MFPSRAVLELGGFGRASRRHESKAYNFTESECWLPALRSRVRARGLVHGYFLRRESLSRVKRCNSAQRGANADLAKHLASAMLRNGVKTRAKTQLRTTFMYARTFFGCFLKSNGVGGDWRAIQEGFLNETTQLH